MVVWWWCARARRGYEEGEKGEVMMMLLLPVVCAWLEALEDKQTGWLRPWVHSQLSVV